MELIMTESHMHLQDIKSSPSLTGQNNNRNMSLIRLNLLTKTTWKLKTPGGILVFWMLLQVWSSVNIINLVESSVPHVTQMRISSVHCAALNIGVSLEMLLKCFQFLYSIFFVHVRPPPLGSNDRNGPSFPMI